MRFMAMEKVDMVGERGERKKKERKKESARR